MRVGVADGVVVDGPPVYHYDGTFGDEVVAVPAIFGCEMVLAEFVDGAPSHYFLHQSQMSSNEGKERSWKRERGYLDDCTDIGEIGFVVEVRWSI